jgi:hypothetical protein
MNSELKNHYIQVWKVLDSQKNELPELLERMRWSEGSRLDIIRLMENLPTPTLATDDDILCIFNEIKTGNLEWSYRLPFCGNLLGVRVREVMKVHSFNEESVNRIIESNRPYWPYTLMFKSFN